MNLGPKMCMSQVGPHIYGITHMYVNHEYTCMTRSDVKHDVTFQELVSIAECMKMNLSGALVNVFIAKLDKVIRMQQELILIVHLNVYFPYTCNSE